MENKPWLEMAEQEAYNLFVEKKDAFVHDTILKVIDWLKINPSSIEAFKDHHPFNDPKLEGLDWSTVKNAQFIDNKLILELDECLE